MTTTEHRTYLPDDVKPLAWAATQLGISRATAYRLASTNKMPGQFRVGRLYRISVPRFMAEVHGEEES